MKKHSPEGVRIEDVPEPEKVLLRNMMQAYRHDLSEFDEASPDSQGLFSLGRFFDAYWTDPDRHPLKLLVGDEVVGFALVRQLPDGGHSIAEFFVLRGWRGRGIGRGAAFQIFDRYPGDWFVAQDQDNLPAQRFWRRVIDEYSEGEFAEGHSEASPRGPKQSFSKS